MGSRGTVTLEHTPLYHLLSAFSPVLYKVVDESTTETVVIRELEAGVEHRFQVTASLEIQGDVYEGEKSLLTEDSRTVFGKPELITVIYGHLCHS